MIFSTDKLQSIILLTYFKKAGGYMFEEFFFVYVQLFFRSFRQLVWFSFVRKCILFKYGDDLMMTSGDKQRNFLADSSKKLWNFLTDESSSTLIKDIYFLSVVVALRIMSFEHIGILYSPWKRV